MNSLVSIMSTVIAIFFLAVAIKTAKDLTELKSENKVLWGQVDRYEEFLKLRGAEDEERQRMAIRN